MIRYLTALCVLAGFVLGGASASASLSDYTFEVSSGTATDMGSATTLWRGYPGSRSASDVNNIVSGVDLPFSFRFDGVDYNRISVSSNGLIGFGTSDVTSGTDNSFGSTGAYPVVTAWWDALTLTGGAQNNCSATPVVQWDVTGSAPNRVFVVEWRDVEVAWRSIAFSTFQVRLFEGSNVIELVYPNMTSIPCATWMSQEWNWTSATIGIAASGSDFMSVIPDYSGASISRDYSYDWVDMSQSQFRIPANTIYRFAPCNVSLVGDIAQGGTGRMVDRDVLLSGLTAQRGGSAIFQPFTITNAMSGCGPRTFRMAIGGDAASEYAIDMETG